MHFLSFSARSTFFVKSSFFCKISFYFVVNVSANIFVSMQSITLLITYRLYIWKKPKHSLKYLSTKLKLFSGHSAFLPYHVFLDVSNKTRISQGLLTLVDYRKTVTGRLSTWRNYKSFLALADFILLLAYFIDADAWTTSLRTSFDKILVMLWTTEVAVKSDL